MKREAVSLVGLAAAVSGLFLTGLILSPNRIAEGVPVGFWSLGATTVSVAALTALVVFGVATLVFVPRLRAKGRARLVLTSVLIPLIIALLALGANAAVSRQGGGRVSPGPGWWALALGVYVLSYDAGRRARARGARLAGLAALLAVVAIVIVLPLDSLGVVQEFANRSERFFQELSAHLALTAVSVGFATLIGIPLGMFAFRSRRGERPIFAIANGLQTIPSLALFGLMIAPLAFLSRQFPLLRTLGIRGVGNAPAVIALVLYGLLPVIRNTFVGLKSIDWSVLDAGRGMGMSRAQLLWSVQVPMALPIVLTGVRITAVQTVGNAAVAALIGARGLGNFVFQGLGQAASDLIVLGVLPIVALAIVIDRGMDALIRALRPGPKEGR